ncbi:MAG: imidazole glycerol phosphate synthase subunit HisH [Spirochaetaceae bacterium]|nr:imidazole glycerol phosphate synthase subunit HisH [Spirochaetaceae bacterium]
MVGIIDYKAGNIKSVERALAALGCQYTIADRPQDLEGASRLIFPGVGDARYAMEQLQSSGFDSFLRESVARQVPVLGICLGSQIVFDFSEEGDTPCLGLIPGTIRHFSSIKKDFSLKVPHMGWNNLQYRNGGSDPIFSGINDSQSYYFVHSYVIQPEDESVIVATADYGITVPAAVRKGSLVAVQFHPEKSGEPGLRLLRNFCLCGEGGLSC